MKYHELPNNTSVKIDYAINWQDEVGSNPILSSSWTVPSDLTKISDSISSYYTRIFVNGGGTLWTPYELTNIITYCTGNNERKISRILGLVTTEMSEIQNISIISGIDMDSIDAYWLVWAYNMVKNLLNTDFSSHQAIQYIDTRNRNDYIVNYDGVRKFALSNTPVISIDSVVHQPKNQTAETLTINDDYYTDLNEGTFELDDDYYPKVGQRTFKVTYTYGYSSIPDIVKEYVYNLIAFTLESNPAKNSDGRLLREVEIGRYREAYATAATALKAKYEKLFELEDMIIKKYKNWDA